MRSLSALVFILLLSACASNKRAQLDKINAAYDARTEAQRHQPATRPNTPSENKPAASEPRAATSDSRAPVKAMTDGPALGNTPVVSNRTSGEWVVTSIKAKFLTVDSTSTRIYMNLTAKSPTGEAVLNPTDFTEHFLVAYVLYPDYNNRDRLGYGNVAVNTQSVKREGDHLTLTFDIQRPKDVASAVLLTEITETNSGTKARNDLPLRFKNLRLSDRFTLFNPDGQQAELRNYATVNDTLLIRDVSGTSKTLHGFRYRHEFEAASSPMNTASRPTSRSLAIDSSLTITTNQPFVLPREGLYYFVEDTTAESGIGLVVADNRFPKLTRPEKLIKPVLYMSTSSEIGELTQAQDTKKALDRYWLSLMAGNEAVARNAIKAYYNRVEEANRLFTTYKEGWKTDKGMIYIVLGAPDRVQRNREREVWVYNRRANVSEVNFTFTRKPNQFVDDHYELVRYIEYQPIWYPVVEAWRTGSVRE